MAPTASVFTCDQCNLLLLKTTSQATTTSLQLQSLCPPCQVKLNNLVSKLGVLLFARRLPYLSTEALTDLGRRVREQEVKSGLAPSTTATTLPTATAVPPVAAQAVEKPATDDTLREQNELLNEIEHDLNQFKETLKSMNVQISQGVAKPAPRLSKLSSSSDDSMSDGTDSGMEQRSRSGDEESLESIKTEMGEEDKRNVQFSSSHIPGGLVIRLKNTGHGRLRVINAFPPPTDARVSTDDDKDSRSTDDVITYGRKRYSSCKSDFANGYARRTAKNKKSRASRF